MAPLLSVPDAVRGPMYRGAEALRGAVGGLTWGPAVGVARTAVLSLLSRIEKGTLLLVDSPAGTRYVFGEKLLGKSGLPRRADTVPRMEVVVKNDAFWIRLFLFADMGFAEAYMLGDFDCQDLTSFFQVRRLLNPQADW